MYFYVMSKYFIQILLLLRIGLLFNYIAHSYRQDGFDLVEDDF